MNSSLNKYVLALLFFLAFSVFKAQENVTSKKEIAERPYTLGLVIYDMPRDMARASAKKQNGPNASGNNQFNIEDEFTHFVFENNVPSKLNLRLENVNLQFMSMQLYDIEGELISNENFDGLYTLIDFSDLAKGYYFLEIRENNDTVGRFKIVKN